MNNLQQQLLYLSRERSPGALYSRSLSMGWCWSLSAPPQSLLQPNSSQNLGFPGVLALVGSSSSREGAAVPGATPGSDPEHISLTFPHTSWSVFILVAGAGSLSRAVPESLVLPKPSPARTSRPAGIPHASLSQPKSSPLYLWGVWSPGPHHPKAKISTPRAPQ